MVNAICKELELRVRELSDQTISSIYFGGGTPSILNIVEINQILNQIYKSYKIDKKIEITIECNPDDLKERKLLEFKKSNINRLSIGVQSFKNKDLFFMNRSHNFKDSINCINKAQSIGFNNITIDLIYGLPKQSIKDWKENLKILFDLNIQHFSAYCLTVEKKTALHKLIKKNEIFPANEKTQIEQYYILTEMANDNNFIQYEISNFGKENFFSKHNIGYWKNQHYIGVGPSAHSYNGNVRRWNISSNKKYIYNINNNKCYYKKEELTLNEKYNEFIFVSIRTMWGVNIDALNKLFGEKSKKHFIKQAEKWILNEMIKKTNSNYTITRKGQILSDNISSDLFIV